MARVVVTGEITPADELRTLLSDSERLLANLQSAEAAQQLLENMDRIAELWPQLEAQGVDLRPEAARWETIQALAHKQDSKVVRALRPAGGLAAARAGRTQGADGDHLGWWWYLDREVTSRNRSRWTRFGVVAVATIVAVAAAAFAFQKLFPVDPRVAAANEHMTTGQQKASQGDLQGALGEFQAASQALPSDPAAWAWVGAVDQKQGHAAASQEAFERARAASSSELDFYLTRAPIYSELNMYDPARADLTAALKLDPSNPAGYYYLATIEEAQGNLQAAAQALDQASKFAEARNQSQLVAMSRLRLGLLLQRMQVVPEGSATP